MYKKISLFLLMSAILSTAFAATATVPAACNVAFCSQASQCRDPNAYIANGCNNCIGQERTIVINGCNSQYNLGVADAQAQQVAVQVATCNANPAAPGCNS